MGKPEYLIKKRPPLGYSNNRVSEPRAVDQMRDLVNKALKDGLWLFDPSIKRWLPPQEFFEMYERHSTLDPVWLDKIQTLDPWEGYIAANEQIKSIEIRRDFLLKKIMDDLKNRTKRKSS